MVPWTHLTQPLKLHLDRFNRLCRAYERDQQTDRQTDRPTDHASPSVTIGRYGCDAGQPNKRIERRST